MDIACAIQFIPSSKYLHVKRCLVRDYVAINKNYSGNITRSAPLNGVNRNIRYEFNILI